MLFWFLTIGIFTLCLLIIAWTSVKFGSDDGVDLRSIKGKRLTEKQIGKLTKLGLSETEIADITK